MVARPRKDIQQVIREVGKYPPEAFQFVQDGLSYAVRRTHGEMSETEELLYEYLHQHDLDLSQVEIMQLHGELSAELSELIERAGGLERLNRHVSGQVLCWELREFALRNYGAMASTVLNHWKIRETRDFGEIVFALVQNDYLQKEPQDTLDDFEGVYQFEEVFDRGFRINLPEVRG